MNCIGYTKEFCSPDSKSGSPDSKRGDPDGKILAVRKDKKGGIKMLVKVHNKSVLYLILAVMTLIRWLLKGNSDDVGKYFGFFTFFINYIYSDRCFELVDLHWNLQENVGE